MQLIGQKTFVIETKLPIPGSFSNKIHPETGLVVPDQGPKYEYQWFAGVGLNPQMLSRGIQQAVNVWTPYPEQAVRYKDRDDAVMVNDKILGATSGGEVLEWNECHKELGRQVIVPVTGEVMAGISNTGLKGKERN